MASTAVAIGFILILLTWIVYLGAIPREQVPARPVLHVVVMVFGVVAVLAGLGGGGISLGVFPIAFGIVAIGLASLFFFLLTIARLPDSELRVAVGDPMLAFTTFDSSGTAIDTTDWMGQRVLLKFFRGKW